MELKPGYKQTEVGLIPEDWEVKRLWEVTDLQVGFAFKSDWFGKHSGPKLLRGENVGYGRVDWTDTRTLEGKQESEFLSYRLNPGDVIIGMDRTFTKTGSKVSMVMGDDLPCLLVQRVGRFVARKIHSGYLWFLLSSDTVQGRLRLEQKGMDIPHLSRSEILHPFVSIPPLPEQKAIAEALSDMDALISGLDDLIAKKRDIKQATMQQLLTGKTRLPGFSGEWEVKRLGELFTFSGGYSASREQLSSEGHCYLHYGDIHGSNRTFIDVDADVQSIPKLDVSLRRVSPVSLLRDGDVVFVDASEDDAGASKHVVVVSRLGKTFISGLHTIIAKALTDKLDNGYKRYCFQTTAIKKQFLFYAVGTKVTGISKSNIPRLLLPVPPLPEQQAIAKVLTDMDAELEALEQRRDKTRELKQAMMQELLTGRTRLV